MSIDLILLLLLLLFSYSCKFYSQTTSVIFENIFLKLFRTLKPKYTTSFVRSMFLAILSLRNQGMVYTSLSFLNSGLIQSTQALGLMLGSYLGLSISLLILNVSSPAFVIFLITTVILLTSMSDHSKFQRVSRLFFHFTMIITSFSFLTYIFTHTNDSSYILNIIKPMFYDPLYMIPFSLVLFIIFKNTFTILGLIYSVGTVFELSGFSMFLGAVSIFIYNSFYFLIKVRKSHRETKLIAFLNLFLNLIVSTLALLVFSKLNLKFIEILIIYSMTLGFLGLLVSFKLQDLSSKLFPRDDHGSTREVILYSSVYNYPATLLIEFFNQEYKKLFVHVTAVFEMILQSLMKSEIDNEKLEKYFLIADKVFFELKKLQSHLHEVEKTRNHAVFVYMCDVRLTALKKLVEALRFIYANHSKIKKENILFFQKVHDATHFLMSEILDKDQPKSVSMSPLLQEWDNLRGHLKSEVDSKTLKEEDSLEIQIQTFKLLEAVKSLN